MATTWRLEAVLQALGFHDVHLHTSEPEPIIPALCNRIKFKSIYSPKLPHWAGPEVSDESDVDSDLAGEIMYDYLSGAPHQQITVGKVGSSSCA